MPNRNYNNLIEVSINSNREPNTKPKDVNKMLLITLLNSRSLRNKVDELSVRANQTNSDIICVTDTWLTDDLTDEAVEINDYLTVRKDRADCNI